MLMFGCKGSMLCVYASPFQLFDMFRSKKLKYLHRYFSLRKNISEKVICDVTMLQCCQVIILQFKFPNAVTFAANALYLHALDLLYYKRILVKQPTLVKISC